tara:strand:- start:349 stop:810 length:462 start_codon:yes stop_codon:yes gene_type:complete
MLNIGDKAPSFLLFDSDLKEFSQESFEGKNYVLFFYPKDDTPGCTIESQDFSRLKKKFESYNTIVLGVSLDSSESHCNFRDKYKLEVPLLADVKGTLSSSYDVLIKNKSNDGDTIKIIRSTFIIDAIGIIKHAFYNVSPKGHATEILNLVKNL